MTSSEASWMIAMVEIGNVFSPVLAGILTDVVGRKICIYINGPIFIMTWVIILSTQSKYILYLARLIQGASFGFVFTVVPLYLGEIASADIRGTVTGMFQSAFYGGMLFEYILGPYTSYFNLTLSSIGFPLLFVACFAWQPESPYYLIMKGKEEEAERSLAWLRGTQSKSDIYEELETMKKSVQEEMCNRASWSDVVGSPSARRALLIVNVVGGVKVLSGIPAILSYATQLFSQSNFLISADSTTIVMGSALFVSSFFSSGLTDVTGRRPLLLISSVGCAISLFVISVYLYTKEKTTVQLTSYTWVPPVFILMYCLLLAFGIDPVSMTYRAEMFPANTRGIAASINSLNFSIGAFLTIKFYQIIEDSVGLYLIYFLFSMSCVVGTILMYVYAIETKGKTLAEVQEEIAKAVNRTCTSKTEITKF